MAQVLDSSVIVSKSALAASFSQSYDVSKCDTVSFDCLFVIGNAVGTVKLQSSNDGVNFVDIPGTSTAVSTSGLTQFNVFSPPYRFINVVYTRTSGTATTYTVTVCAKSDTVVSN